MAAPAGGRWSGGGGDPAVGVGMGKGGGGAVTARGGDTSLTCGGCGGGGPRGREGGAKAG